MYNRILKRPMFRRGGPSFSAQGTGITSPFDTPRRGLVQHPGGYAGKTLEELAIEKEQIFAPKPYQNINDIIESFGEYSNVRNEDGSFKTTGEQGALQAEGIKKVRTDRENEQKLAALSNVEAQEAALAKEAEEAAAMARTEKSIWGSMEAAKINANRKLEVDRQQEMMTEAAVLLAELKRKYGSVDKIPPEEYAEYEDLRTIATKGKFMTYAEAVEAANEIFSVNNAKLLDEHGVQGIQDLQEDYIYKITGGLWGTPLPPQGAKGGRVREDRIGLQQSYPGTAGDAQQASFTNTETVTDSPQGITMTDTMTEESTAEDIFSGQTEDPYRLLRARLPQEITDDVVRLIAYNEEAFKDFAEIESQSDVMDFNRKYGVELVLPTDDMA
tara:strand:+ start:117 stop:1274 length:1158 start_codon:yes stop_codon:yes gene_type:complete